MELVLLTTFDNAVDAHILKSRLESEGVECYLYDENIVGMNPLFSHSVGGIKLMINKKDAENALKILSEIENSPIKDDNDQRVKCPNCGSEDIYDRFKSMQGIKGVLSAIVSFLFMVFPIYYKTVYKCKSCGTEFK
ncbi:putative signal transducing protein [Marinigracilibium pacificum]|uniref:DUF2007 domain-containing protein n=1 Tax=Marinigracilibium pacificum TaxID=2729599 RepID=A0A848IT72_9BACT|nr:DUF2007 domain-containing protein [Marinigracilibium pacificum]NMM47663.1 DUF2007 domain-containing protein [Marinigracilibium pacificum]